MTTNKVGAGHQGSLRSDAEQRLAGRPKFVSALSPEDAGNLLHQLEVHQIELEMQNEELRRTQAELLESRDRYVDLYEFAPVGYLTVDNKGTILEANCTASVMLCVERASLIGGRLQRFLVPESADAVSLLFQTLIEPGEQRTCEVKLATEDGRVGHVHLQSICKEGAADHARNYRVALVDRTELHAAEMQRRQLETKLRQTQRLEGLGLLAGGIAHDFNNLLVGIVKQADVLAAQLDHASPWQQNIEQIQTAAVRSADLCQQMLAYSGQGNFEKRVFDLSEVVGEMAELVKSATTSSVALQYDLVDDLPGIEGDVTSIRQVVMNLVLNAAESIRGNTGAVTVTTGVMSASAEYLAGTYLDDGLDAGEFVYLRVADTGCGMGESSMEKIFDPFFTTKFTGRGLGMAAVLGIIRGHGGAIEIESRPGRGTTIQVLFPATDQVASGNDDLPVAGEAAHGIRTVLIVDDEEVVRLAMNAVLQMNGYNVLLAADGEEALQLFQQRADEIAVVLLDLTMPGLSGVAVCEQLCDLAPKVPVLLMSGFCQEDVLSNFTSRNFAGFVHKPLGDVVGAVRGALVT